VPTAALNMGRPQVQKHRKWAYNSEKSLL
jgi:hypothetical protein